MIVVLGYCKRHRYKVARVASMDFPLPNGCNSGKRRAYEFIKCRVCGYESGRWQKQKTEKIS